MHELSIAQALLGVATDEAGKVGAHKVLSITLQVGALCGVVPELLQSCFPFAAEQTVAEGARLEIEPVPGRARCGECRVEFELSDLAVVCPACGGSPAELLAGRDLILTSMELEDPLES